MKFVISKEVADALNLHKSQYVEPKLLVHKLILTTNNSIGYRFNNLCDDQESGKSSAFAASVTCPDCLKKLKEKSK